MLSKCNTCLYTNSSYVNSFCARADLLELLEENFDFMWRGLDFRIFFDTDQVSLGLWWSTALRGRSVDTACWGPPSALEFPKVSPSRSSKCSSLLTFCCLVSSHTHRLYENSQSDEFSVSCVCAGGGCIFEDVDRHMIGPNKMRNLRIFSIFLPFLDTHKFSIFTHRASNLAATIQISVTNPNPSIHRLNRASQTYFFPIHLTDQLLPSAVFYATVGPLVFYLAIQQLVIRPYVRAQKEE